jgi:Protein of unknwon function (DUF3310)
MPKNFKSPFESELILATLSPEEREAFTQAWEQAKNELGKVVLQEDLPKFNEPAHYHKHNMDTILFLQEGFPPEVFLHFCLANVIKYAQRAPYKNGREDLEKMVDYAKRALDWYDKTHS